jgi:hypothetical protein
MQYINSLGQAAIPPLPLGSGLLAASWNESIAKQQTKLNRMIRRNPGLKQYIPELYRDAYADAVKQASKETYLPIDHFPAVNPLPTWEDALDYAAPVPPTPPLRPVRKPKGKINRKRQDQ